MMVHDLTQITLLSMLMAGVTALHAAALDGKLDTVRYLLDNGADPNKKDEPGEVPLHCAAKYGLLSANSEPYIDTFVDFLREIYIRE